MDKKIEKELDNNDLMFDEQFKKNEQKQVINIKKDDLYNFNLYLASLNKNLGVLMGGTIIFIFGLYGIFNDGKEALFVNIFICILGLLSYLFVFVISKLIIKRKIKKLNLEDMPAVEVTLNDDGILYKFKDEVNNEGKEFYPFAWKEVSRAVVTNDYLYIHMIDRRTVLLIIMKDIDNNEFIDYIKDKLLPVKRYYDKRSKS